MRMFSCCSDEAHPCWHRKHGVVFYVDDAPAPKPRDVKKLAAIINASGLEERLKDRISR